MNEDADERGLGSVQTAHDPARRRRTVARTGLLRTLADIETFGSAVLGMPLRQYQATVARAVLESIDRRHGHSVTVMMPRQSGKNQLSAHLEAFLLTRKQRAGGSLVKCAPTFQPQVQVSIDRLLRALDNPLTHG